MLGNFGDGQKMEVLKTAHVVLFAAVCVEQSFEFETLLEFFGSIPSLLKLY